MTKKRGNENDGEREGSIDKKGEEEDDKGREKNGGWKWITKKGKLQRWQRKMRLIKRNSTIN